MDQPYATLLSALIGAILGSLVVAWAAWVRFRQERVFDRRLQWYESMVRASHTFVQKVEIALTWQEETLRGNRELLKESWREVQKAQLAVERLCLEAPLFGSAAATGMTEEMTSLVQTVSDSSGGFDPNFLERKERPIALEQISTLPERLRKLTSSLAQEGRHHLGIR